MIFRDIASALFIAALFLSVLIVSMASTRLIFGFNKNRKGVITDIKATVVFLVFMVVSGSLYIYITEI